MSNFWKSVIGVLIILALIVAGFFIGRSTVSTETKTETKYVTLPPKTDTLYYPKPCFLEMPVDTADVVAAYIKLHPEQFTPDTVTIEKYMPTKVDTMAILSDWMIKRKYSEVLFDDETGKCVTDFEVQYNQLQHIAYKFTPVQSVVTNTEYRIKLFEPFIGAGMSLTGFVMFDVGTYIKGNFGIGYNYMYDTGILTKNKMHHHGFKAYYKF